MQCEVFIRIALLQSRHLLKQNMALLDCAINEKCCSVDRRWGIFPLFSSPPQGIWQLKIPRSQELAVEGKKSANAQGSAWLGDSRWGRGVVGPSWNWLMLKAGFHWWRRQSRSGRRNPKSAYDLVKIKNWSHKYDGIRIRRIRTFPFLLTPLMTPSLAFCLWSSENQIVRVGSRSRRINQSQCTFPCLVTGLVLPLLLPTPTIWFLLEHKRNVSDGVISRIRTLFSLDHKLCASDYDSDSDSVTSENQP